MSSVVFYKDISKRKGDLLTKEFGYDENKFKFLGKSGDVSFETTLTTKGESTVATFAPKYEYKPWKATFSGEVNTKKDYKGEVSIKDPLPGLKVTLTDAVNEKGLLGTVAVEYTKDLAAVTASADLGSEEGNNFKGSANLNVWKSLNFGGSVHYLLGKSSKVKEIKATAAWNTPEFDIAATGTVKSGNDGDKTELAVGYFHKVNDTLSVATELTLDPNNSDSKKDTKLTFGTQYKLDENATVKAKVDVSGKVGLSYIQKFSKTNSFTLAANIDTNYFSNKNTAQFGFAVNLE